MIILDVPASVAFRNAQWTRVTPTQTNRGPWTQKRTTMRLPGAAIWKVGAECVTMIGQAATLELEAFLENLDGNENAFRMIAVEGAQHAGAEALQGAAAAGAMALPLTGMPASATFLRAGQKLTVRQAGGGEQLVRLSADVVANASGNGTATFRTPLRKAATNGATCGTKWPWAVVAFNDPETTIPVEAGGLYAFAFDATETWL